MLYVHLLVNIFDFYLIDKMGRTFLGYKSGKRWTIILSGLLWVCTLFVINRSTIALFNTACYVLMSLFYFYCAFKGQWRSKLLIGFMASSAVVFIEYILTAVVPSLFGIDISQAIYNELARVSLLIVTRSAMYFIAMMATKMKKSEFRVDKRNGYILCYPIINLAIFYYIYHISLYLQKGIIIQYASEMLFLSGIVIFISSIFMWRFYHMKDKMYMLEQDNDNIQKYLGEQEMYFKLQKEQNTKIAELTHDYKNRLYTLIYTTESDGDTKSELRSMYEELTQLNTDIPKYSNNESLNGLLFMKMSISANEGIAFVFRLDKCDLSFIAHRDIAIVFGNAMDNAINACKHKGEYNRPNTICVEGFSLNRMTRVVMTNGFESRQMEQQESSDFLHGHGLNNIAKVITQYNGIMTTKIVGNKFVLSLEFQNITNSHE